MPMVDLGGQPMMDIGPEVVGQPEKPDLGPDSVPDNGDFQGLVDYCLGLYDKFKESQYRKDKLQEIIDGRKVYEQKEEATDFPWTDASNITLPLTTITIDNLEPRLVAGLVGQKPVVRMEMEGEAERDPITLLIEEWFNRQLESKVGIETRGMSFVHTLLLEGTLYVVPKYNREEIKRRDFVFDPNTGMVAINPQDGKPMTRDFTDTLYEGGELETVPFTDILCADDIGTLKEWERGDKIRLVRPTYGDLMRSKGDIGYLTDKIGPWLLPQSDSGEKKEEQQSPAQRVVGAKYTGKESVECAEFYVTYQINKDEDEPDNEQSDFTEDRLLATIHLASKTLIRVAYLRELNFQNDSLIKRVRLFPEEGRSFGTSIYGKMKSIQNGASDFFNAILNIAYIAMLPWFFYEDSAGMRGKVEITPGKGVPVDSVKGILFPNFNINPSAYLSFIEMFMGLWERLGSVANPQIGRPDDQSKTATEIMMVVQEGNIKFDYQSKTMKEEFISILKTLYDLYYQHMPYDYKIQVGDQVGPFPRQAMRRGFKFCLTGSTAMANKLIERKEADELLMLAVNNPLMNPVTPLEDVLKARGKVDLGRYINPQGRQIMDAATQNPELVQVIQKYLQTKAQTAAELGMEGGNGPAKRPGVPGIQG